MKWKKYSDFISNLLNTDIDKFKSFEEIIGLSLTVNNRELFLQEEISDEIANVINSCIRFWNYVDDEEEIPIEERQPIQFYIDTPGGGLSASLSIIDTIRLSRTPVHTINVNGAYSGGFFIFIAGHKRFCYPHSSFLYHEGSIMTGGDAGKFRNFAEFYKKQLESLKDVTLKYTKISEEEYDRHIKDDWWFTADEALQYGICDEIIKELK